MAEEVGGHGAEVIARNEGQVVVVRRAAPAGGNLERDRRDRDKEGLRAVESYAGKAHHRVL